ncbi:hypothetical protein C1645_818909 [Glomus cerebriforme]|uniref:Uncharacterized protein n=1 Tax=Glomus cerebriforme TaxID=658196 RepID=A0A397T6D2_9GLOM|nr:hypothetical protein C1645_818909 [Glomus cerebriforme]
MASNKKLNMDMQPPRQPREPKCGSNLIKSQSFFKDNLQTAKVGYSNGNQYSICCLSNNGPVFVIVVI